MRRWFHTVTQAEWHSFAEVRATYANADQVDRFTVFNIGGNKYRLIAALHYNTQRVYVLRLLTHAEYSKGFWKDDL